MFFFAARVSKGILRDYSFQTNDSKVLVALEKRHKLQMVADLDLGSKNNYRKQSSARRVETCKLMIQFLRYSMRSAVSIADL